MSRPWGEEEAVVRPSPVPVKGMRRRSCSVPGGARSTPAPGVSAAIPLSWPRAVGLQDRPRCVGRPGGHGGAELRRRPILSTSPGYTPKKVRKMPRVAWASASLPVGTSSTGKSRCTSGPMLPRMGCTHPAPAHGRGVARRSLSCYTAAYGFSMRRDFPRAIPFDEGGGAPVTQ